MAPPYGLLATGFNAKTSNDVFDELATDQIAAIGPLWNARNLALVGVFNSTFATQMGALWEAMAQVHKQFDPRDAEGEGLDSVGDLRGVRRRPQRRSVVFCNCLMLPGTVITPFQMVAHVIGDTNRRFRNSFGFTVPGAGMVGVVVSVQFESEEFGAIEAPATFLGIMDTVVPGLISSPNNPQDAILGDDVESDEAYRIRQDQELAGGGSATQPAIIAALGAVPNVVTVAVLNNDTDAVVDTIPAHSMECVVEGGDPQTIGDTIFREKAPGDGTSGNQTTNVTAPDGLVHVIRWTRPINVSIWLNYVIRVTSDYPGDAAFKTFIVNWANGYHAAGMDVVPSRFTAKCFEIPGVYAVEVSEAGFSAGSLTTAIRPINTRSRAAFDVVRVTVGAI